MGAPSMAKHVDFYFALNSRYSYLAASQIAALEEEGRAEVTWRPLDFDLLMVARKWDPFSGAPTSGQYDITYRRKDVSRWAEYYDIQLRIVEWEKYDWLRFNLAATEAAKEHEGCAKFAQAVFALTMGEREERDNELRDRRGRTRRRPRPAAPDRIPPRTRTPRHSCITPSQTRSRSACSACRASCSTARSIGATTG